MYNIHKQTYCMINGNVDSWNSSSTKHGGGLIWNSSPTKHGGGLIYGRVSFLYTCSDSKTMPLSPKSSRGTEKIDVFHRSTLKRHKSTSTSAIIILLAALAYLVFLV